MNYGWTNTLSYSDCIFHSLRMQKTIDKTTKATCDFTLACDAWLFKQIFIESETKLNEIEYSFWSNYFWAIFLYNKINKQQRKPQSIITIQKIQFWIQFLVISSFIWNITIILLLLFLEFLRTVKSVPERATRYWSSWIHRL